MQCPRCGAPLAAPDRYCAACGARVAPRRPIRCPACQHLCDAAMPACPRCQTPLESGNGLSAIPRGASLQERAFSLLRRAFVRFADFQGRSSRSEFFLFMAFCQFAGLVLAAVWWPLASLFSAAMLIPSFAVSVRRMRDAGYYPWTPFVLSGAATVLLAAGIAAGAVLGFSASGWRLSLAVAGVSSALLLLVCGLFLFLVLQPTAEPGEEKRLLGLGARGQGQDEAFAQGAFPGQPFPGQAFPGQPFPGQPGAPQPFPDQPSPVQPGAPQPFSDQPSPVQPFPQQPFSGQSFPGQPFPGQAGPQQAFPGQAFPEQPSPGQPFPDQPSPGLSSPGQPFPQPACPGAPSQPASAGEGGRLPDQPGAGGAPHDTGSRQASPESRQAVPDGQSEVPPGMQPDPRQASPAPGAPPAGGAGQPAERMICRQAQDAGAVPASSGCQDGGQDVCQDGGRDGRA